MLLNLPILDTLADHDTILIAGAGGGFDIFAGLPLFFTLRALGKTVHFANYSFTAVPLISKTEQLETLVPDRLIGVRGPVKRRNPYYPEGYLAQWFSEVQHDPQTIWLFARPGALPLKENYDTLIDHLGIDALILVDGGIDSLMHGDEEKPGTLLEDTLTLTAVEDVDLPVKILACLGFGAELEANHHHALENIATLIKAGGFLGSCTLVKTMPVYQLYEAACRYVWEQRAHAKSHISMRVVSAVNGEFGNHHLYHDRDNLPVFVSALMSLYWFFDADTVTQHSLIAGQLKMTRTIREAMQIVNLCRPIFDIRPMKRFPH